MSPGKGGLERTKYLLSLLDNPQEKIKVIHVAGTSGKGSTASFISYLLAAHGLKVGLHFKPHVFDIRERFQINNMLMSKEKTGRYAEEVFKAVRTVGKSSFGLPTYFETLVALAYYSFYREHVDYAVIETGLGGLYDGTNVVSNPNKFSVITRLGIDHTTVLGTTKKAIAFQKAGIIQPGNSVISIFQESGQRNVLEDVAKNAKTKVMYVKKSNYKTIGNRSDCFSYQYKKLTLPKIHLNTPGIFQIENAALALTVLYELGMKNNITLSEKAIRQVFHTIQIPGRYQKLTYQNTLVICDGAHNTQKMEALLKSIARDYPKQKFICIIAFKQGKDSKAMIKQLVPFAKEILFTTFESGQDIKGLSQDPNVVSRYAQKVPIIIERSSIAAFAYAASKKQPILITGSLYLASYILSHFFHQVDNAA